MIKVIFSIELPDENVKMVLPIKVEPPLLKREHDRNIFINQVSQRLVNAISEHYDKPCNKSK